MSNGLSVTDVNKNVCVKLGSFDFEVDQSVKVPHSANIKYITYSVHEGWYRNKDLFFLSLILFLPSNKLN